MLGLINEILEFTRLEAGKTDITLTSCNLPQLINEIVNMFRLKAQNKGIDLSVEIDSEVAFIARFDISKVKQVLINLLDNALKFTDQGFVKLQAQKISGPISQQPFFSTKKTQALIQFQVIDTGYGIAEEDLKSCLLYTSPSPRDQRGSRMPSSA